MGNEAYDQPMEIEDEVPETHEETNDSYVTRLEERLARKDEELSKLKDLLKQKDKEIFELKKQISTTHVGDMNTSTPGHLSETIDISEMNDSLETKIIDNEVYMAISDSDDENNDKGSDSDMEDIQDRDETSQERQQLRENIDVEIVEDQLLRDEPVATDEVQSKGDNSQEHIRENDAYDENEGLEAKEQTYPRRSRRVSGEKLKKQEALILKEKLEIKDDSRLGLRKGF